MSAGYHLEPVAAQTDLRPPATVMRLSRMGSFFPTRLSFLRSLLRDMAVQKSTVLHGAKVWDDDGFGHATFETTLDGRTLTLIAWTAPLNESARTDRVIATAWDACFVLFDGRPTPDDIAALADHACTQEAGRYDPRILVVSRANKSVRLFEEVVTALSAGRQPATETLLATGYLMRTTAVYGNGKFGMADRKTAAAPFRLEMLAVWLIREFTFALVEHVARVRNKAGAALSETSRRMLGIGNSTGLGMAPFLVSHPVLLNNWMMVRETALARVRALESAAKANTFSELRKRAARHLDQWNVADETELKRIEDLRAEFAAFDLSLDCTRPWDALIRRSEPGSEDLQELIVALVLEPHGDLIDGLTDCMGADRDAAIEPGWTVGRLQSAIETDYEWALSLDLDDPEESANCWYVSEEKLEPRFGDASTVPDEYRRMPHDIPKRIQALYAALRTAAPKTSVTAFLAADMSHRATVARLQTAARFPYGEIRDNLVAEGVRPIDLLRCKLSFFGASKFDPRSDRWTRIVLFQGAPSAGALSADTADDVFLPAFDA